MTKGISRKAFDKLLQSAAKRQRQLSMEIATPPTRSPKPRKKKLPPMVKWLRGASAATVFFGWGGLMLADLFWIGVVGINLGFAFIALDFAYEPDFRGKWKLKSVMWAGLLVLGLSINWGIIFVEAPLGVSGITTNGEYPSNTVISGINWRPEFTELNMYIQNPTAKAYEDLNIVIRPSSAVAAIAQVTDYPGVSFEDKNSVNARLLDQSLDTGISKAHPIVVVATDAGYRVRCPHFPAHANLKIVMALVELVWPSHLSVPDDATVEQKLLDRNYLLQIKFSDFSTYWLGYKDGDVFSKRPTSTDFVSIEGDYIAAHRRRIISQKIEVGGIPSIRRLAQPAGR